MIFVDTSAFYALACETDEAHPRALVIHERLKREGTPFLTTNYVMLETVSLIQRRHGVACAERVSDAATEHTELVWIDADQHHAAWRMWKAQRKRELSVVDCACFVVMRERGIRAAFSFDEQFRAAGFALVEERPADRVEEPRARYRVRRAHGRIT